MLPAAKVSGAVGGNNANAQPIASEARNFRMIRFPIFGIYCVASWWVFMYQPLLSINLLLFGAVVFGLRRERQAALNDARNIIRRDAKVIR